MWFVHFSYQGLWVLFVVSFFQLLVPWQIKANSKVMSRVWCCILRIQHWRLRQEDRKYKYQPGLRGEILLLKRKEKEKEDI